MQSLISNGCVKKYYLYFVLIRNNIRCINNTQEMELHTKKCHKWIDVDFWKIRNKYHQSWITVDGDKRDTKFDCKLFFIQTDLALPLHWRRWLVFPYRLCGSNRLWLSFLYRLLTLTRGPDTIFSKLKIASFKYYTP
jgi:hypothetical protein